MELDNKSKPQKFERSCQIDTLHVKGTIIDNTCEIAVVWTLLRTKLAWELMPENRVKKHDLSL